MDTLAPFPSLPLPLLCSIADRCWRFVFFLRRILVLLCDVEGQEESEDRGCSDQPPLDPQQKTPLGVFRAVDATEADWQ